MKLKFYLFILFYHLFFGGPLEAFPLLDARNLALGGTAVTSPDTASAVFINPAVLGGAEELRTAFTQTRLSINNFDFGISAAFPLVKKQFGVGLGWDAEASRNQSLTGFVRDSNGQYVIDPVTGMPQTVLLGFFTQNTNSFYLSAGFQLENISIGASLKYYLANIGGQEGTGFGWDAAFRALLVPGLSWGGAFFDIKDSVIVFKDRPTNQTIPMSASTSLSWLFWSNEEFSIMAEPGLSKNSWNGSDVTWGAGVEAAWKKNVFVRVGLNQQRFSAGVGLVAHPEKIFKEVRVDYTYLDQAPDGYPSRLTLSVAW